MLRGAKVHCKTNLILKLASPDGLPPRAVAFGVARLDHEALDDSERHGTRDIDEL